MRIPRPTVCCCSVCVSPRYSSRTRCSRASVHDSSRSRVFQVIGTSWLACVRDGHRRVERSRVFAPRYCRALGCALSHSGHSRHDRHRARKEELPPQQQGRWLGTSGLLGGAAVRAVFTRRWPVDPDPLTRFANFALTPDRPTRHGHAAGPRSQGSLPARVWAGPLRKLRHHLDHHRISGQDDGAGRFDIVLSKRCFS